MSISEVVTAEGVDAVEMMGRVAALERYSEHSIAKAVLDWAQARDVPRMAMQGVENVPGFGMKGIVAGQEVLIGTAAWLMRNGIDMVDALNTRAHKYEASAMSCVHVALDGRHAGLFVVADRLRSDASALVASLRAMGIGMTILSGDRLRVVEAIATELGGLDVVAEVLPQDKDRVIQSLQKDGRTVAMVGDGVNDAPALIRADVGIALGSGTDVSGESADIVLMGDELSKVRQAMQLSLRTLRTIRQNIGISVVYNIIMVPLAMATVITPLVAAIAMPISSLLVIGNAARIRTMFSKGD